MPQEYTHEEVLEIIKERCKPPSSQAEQARITGADLGHLNRVVNGHFQVSKEMAEKFGFIEKDRAFIQKVEVVHE